MILEGLSTKGHVAGDSRKRQGKVLGFYAGRQDAPGCSLSLFRWLTAARWRCPGRGVLWQAVGGPVGSFYRVSVEMVGKGSVSQPFFFPLIITP